MKTHAQEGLVFEAARFLFCSADAGVAQHLGQSLSSLGMVVQEIPALDALVRRLHELDPSVVFLDFTAASDPGRLLMATDLARVLARVAPTLPRVAVVGSETQTEGALAALRAGVSGYVDLCGKPGEIVDVVQQLLAFPVHAQPDKGVQRSILLMGARAGVGVSTLAVHAAGCAQQRLSRRYASRSQTGRQDAAAPPLSERVSLLDLGYPVADCMLYFNLSGDFDFAEAVRNLDRLDATLFNTAMAHTPAGVNVMALPRDLSQMRDLSFSDSLALYERLRQHSGMVMIDAGGHDNIEFLSELTRACSDAWLVTDQSVSALVALDGLLAELDRRNIERDRLGLVINRYDERYGMSAAQISERFRVPLAGLLPDRTQALMACMNQGRLLHQQSDRDAYVKAVRQLVGSAMDDRSAPRVRRRGGAFGWLHRLRRQGGF